MDDTDRELHNDENMRKLPKEMSNGFENEKKKRVWNGIWSEASR
jgi:hypothetical protein